MTSIELKVNGKTLRADVTPRTHLADFLREQLLLTGTHIGCEHGICGACTVEIDGEIARSCITYAVACDGAEVTTIEGLSERAGGLTPLQAAFQSEHALQCGYCTPGFVVSAHAFLAECPTPSDEEIRDALSGNLCRCTGYQGIIAAVKRAASADNGSSS